MAGTSTSLTIACHHELMSDFTRAYHVALSALTMVMETAPLDLERPGDFQGLPAGSLSPAS
jgi:hypothetical protein